MRNPTPAFFKTHISIALFDGVVETKVWEKANVQLASKITNKNAFLISISFKLQSPNNKYIILKLLSLFVNNRTTKIHFFFIIPNNKEIIITLDFVKKIA